MSDMICFQFMSDIIMFDNVRHELKTDTWWPAQRLTCNKLGLKFGDKIVAPSLL